MRRLQLRSPSNSDIPWANSEPVICEGVLSGQQIYLTPAYFLQTFGNEEVELTDCESGESKTGTLEDILKLFDSSQDPHSPVWKVKVCSSLLYVMKLKQRITRTGRLKPRSEVENLQKYMKSLKTTCHSPI